MDLTWGWNIDMQCHFTTTERRRKTQRGIAYCTTPRMDGCMEAGESVTCTVEEVSLNRGLKYNLPQVPVF